MQQGQREAETLEDFNFSEEELRVIWKEYDLSDEVSEKTRAIIDRLVELGSNPQIATPEEIKRADRYYTLKQELDKDEGNLAMTLDYDIDHIDMKKKAAYVNVAIGMKDKGKFLYNESINECKFDEVCEDCAEVNELCKKCMELRDEQE